jgi:hypothetical protein
VGNLQRRHVTKDVAPESPLGTGLHPEHISATPTVGGRRADITRTGGLGMESDYFWLVLLIGAAVLLMLVALERMYF